jgi:hypothetical protein
VEHAPQSAANPPHETTPHSRQNTDDKRVDTQVGTSEKVRREPENDGSTGGPLTADTDTTGQSSLSVDSLEDFEKRSVVAAKLSLGLDTVLNDSVFVFLRDRD